VAEDDSPGFVDFVNRWGSSLQIIGDDFLVINAQRVLNAADNRAANAVLVKPSQAGTITEIKAALDAAKQVGSFSRSERMAKWNECLRIEESLGAAARFAGGAGLVYNKD
jgi:enolase